MSARHRRVGPAILAVVLLGCAQQHHDVGVPRTPRQRRLADPAPGNNWPLPPAKAEQLFANAPIELVSVEHTEHGVAGAMKGSVTFPPDSRPVTVKWKEVPGGDMDGWNNNPRKEIAAYKIQEWFLEPKDYVIPTVALRCVPLARYRRLVPDAKPTIAGTSCVLGTLSLWLEHVTVPEPLFDPQRFATDYAYAYHLSDLNVVTYLIRHRDGRPGNILAADTDADRRVFAVDNGISFDGLIYNFLTTNWDVIRVPAIRRSVVQRLRKVDRRQLDALGTLAELRADKKGVLRPAPLQPPIDPEQGVRVSAGRVQMGLTRSEIDGLARRLADLLTQVDQGTIKTF